MACSSQVLEGLLPQRKWWQRRRLNGLRWLWRWLNGLRSLVGRLYGLLEPDFVRVMSRKEQKLPYPPRRSRAALWEFKRYFVFLKHPRNEVIIHREVLLCFPTRSKKALKYIPRLAKFNNTQPPGPSRFFYSYVEFDPLTTFTLLLVF